MSGLIGVLGLLGMVITLKNIGKVGEIGSGIYNCQNKRLFYTSVKVYFREI